MKAVIPLGRPQVAEDTRAGRTLLASSHPQFFLQHLGSYTSRCLVRSERSEKGKGDSFGLIDRSRFRTET